MPRLMLLTFARDDPRFGGGPWIERLCAPLAAAGIEAVACPWTEADDVSGFDAVTPLMAWSYHREPEAWLARLDALAASGVRVINPVATLRWNTVKTYLADLEAAGVPIVPTLFADKVTPAVLAEARARFGDELIVKPQVSAGSFATVRVSGAGPIAGGPDGPAMLQPFLPAIAEEGELSLLYFGGEFSHAVRKRAGAGDFRIQQQHGGIYSPAEPPAEALAIAEQAVAAAPPLTYARIDLIRDRADDLRLMELETIEPDLYLQHARDGGAAFVQAMLAALEE